MNTDTILYRFIDISIGLIYPHFFEERSRIQRKTGGKVKCHHMEGLIFKYTSYAVLAIFANMLHKWKCL